VAEPQDGRVMEIEIRDKDGNIKKACPALIDPGADVNLVSKETVDWCELGTYIQLLGHEDSPTLVGLGGHDVKPCGKITFPFSRKMRFRIVRDETFYVVENAPYEIILGNVFASKCGLVIFDHNVLVAGLKKPSKS